VITQHYNAAECSLLSSHRLSRVRPSILLSHASIRLFYILTKIIQLRSRGLYHLIARWS